MPKNTDQRIRALIESFVTKLSEQVREAAVESVRQAFGDGAPRAPRRARAARREPDAPKSAPIRRKKGGKRDPEMLAALVEKLGAFIVKSPGQRIEEIAPALGTTTKELALPARKLIEAKTVTTKGRKRATTYHPR